MTGAGAPLPKDGAWPDPESITLPELSCVLQLAKVSFSLEATKGHARQSLHWGSAKTTTTTSCAKLLF